MAGMDEHGVAPTRPPTGGHSPGHHLVMAVVVGGVGLLADGRTEARISAALVASIAATELGYGLTAVAYLFRRDHGLGATLGWPSPRAFAAGIVVALSLVAIGQGLLTFVPGVGIDDLVAGTAGPVSPGLLLGLAVVSVLFVGPAEELLFRGAVYGTLRQGFGPVVANVLASALFVIAHVGSLGAGLAGLVPLGIVFVGSLLFGYAYERTGTLVVPVAMHAAYDAALFSLAYVLLP